MFGLNEKVLNSEEQKYLFLIYYESAEDSVIKCALYHLTSKCTAKWLHIAHRILFCIRRRTLWDMNKHSVSVSYW